MFVLFITGISLGIVGTSIVLRFGPASEWLIWPIPSLLSPFVGVFYPLATLPAWMRAISRLLPPSYVFEGMRAIVTGKSARWDQLAFGSVLSVLYLVAACGLFAAVYSYALRTGLIARYSAETAN